uniref:Uncharacterized protein n=1 Tax=Rhizophora mucronata TaxID=61149 RepID=A0A2P2Q352_RHIMU
MQMFISLMILSALLMHILERIFSRNVSCNSCQKRLSYMLLISWSF